MPMPDAPAQKERQLNLVLALDSARDAHAEAHAMFQAMVQNMRTTFEADACALLILTDSGDDVEFIAQSGMGSQLAVALCKQATQLSTPTGLMTERWPYTLGLQITLDNVPLGGVILARTVRPFTQSEHDLLTVAESQIDSAVIQARRASQLLERTRQLEAIYRIDHLRDENSDENALINAFTTLLNDYFKADLILILLRGDDSKEAILRGILDKSDVSTDALRAMRSLAAGVTRIRTITAPPLMAHLTLIAAPLVVADQRLGEVVIGRQRIFTRSESDLFQAMITQMDSAVAHSRLIMRLRQRNRELETIYRIDQIRDSEDDLDSMLQAVLNELCRAIDSEMGYLMLFSEDAERKLELRATTGAIAIDIYLDTIHDVTRETLELAMPVYKHHVNDEVRSIVAIPLTLNESIIGVFGAVNSVRSGGFSSEDRRMLQAITSQVDTAVFERLARRRMRQVLSRSVDPKIIDLLLDNADGGILAGERVFITSVFADLRGSTEWAARTAPEPLVSTLNQHLTVLTDIIFKYGGTLDKFVGDEVIALFGAPVAMQDHALKAVQCALEMRQAHAKLRADLAAKDIELPPVGIGISTGEAIAGEMGSPVRTDFTAMGPVMNMGARLCGVASGGQVLIDAVTRDTVHNRATTQQLESVELKGIGMVDVYELRELQS